MSWVSLEIADLKHHPSQVGEKFVTPPPFDIAGSCLVNERNAPNASSQLESIEATVTENSRSMYGTRDSSLSSFESYLANG